MAPSTWTIADLAAGFQAPTFPAIVRITIVHLSDPSKSSIGVHGRQVSEVDNAERGTRDVRGGQIPPIGNAVSPDAHRIPQPRRPSRRPRMHMGQCQHYRLWCRSSRWEAWTMSRRSPRWRAIDMIALWPLGLSARLAFISQLEHPTFKAACADSRRPARGMGTGPRAAETEAQIEEYWRLGCKVLNCPAMTSARIWMAGRPRASRAHARLKSIGCGRCLEKTRLSGRGASTQQSHHNCCSA